MSNSLVLRFNELRRSRWRDRTQAAASATLWRCCSSVSSTSAPAPPSAAFLRNSAVWDQLLARPRAGGQISKLSSPLSFQFFTLPAGKKRASKRAECVCPACAVPTDILECRLSLPPGRAWLLGRTLVSRLTAGGHDRTRPRMHARTDAHPKKKKEKKNLLKLCFNSRIFQSLLPVLRPGDLTRMTSRPVRLCV